MATDAETALMMKISQAMFDYRQDPVGFGVNVLGLPGTNIWPKMQAVVESVRDYQKTAVPAAHSVSKTFGAGRLTIPWFKTCFTPSTVVTTAPSSDMVEQQMWREIHAAVSGALYPLGGTLTKTMWDVKPSDKAMKTIAPGQRPQWEKNFAIGFSTKPDAVTDAVTKLQGYHNDWVLVLIDEAAGILPPIWKTALLALITNKQCKILVQGNCTDPDSPFADACRLEGRLDHLERFSEPYMSDKGWHVVPIAVMDTPNYIEDREVIPGLAGRDYERNVLTEYPNQRNEWLIRCRGAFPTSKEGTYYGHEIAAAQAAGSIGRFLHDPTYPVTCISDFGDRWTACIHVQFIHDRVRVVSDYWDNEGQGAPAMARAMDAMPYKWGKNHFAGPDLEGSNKKSFQTGNSTRDILRGLGYNFKAVLPHSFDNGIQEVRALFPVLDIDENNAPHFIKAVKGYHKIKNMRLSTEHEPEFHQTAAHTWHSHMADALRHLAMARKYQPIDGQYLGSHRAVARQLSGHAGPHKRRNDIHNRDRYYKGKGR